MVSTRHRTTIALLTLIALFSTVASAQASLDLRFGEMESHIGQALHLRVVDTTSRQEIARLTVPEISESSFEMEISGLSLGSSIRIDVYVDVNDNGSYDAPPIDHAWRVELAEVRIDGSLTFVHSTAFTDVGWPPAIDGVLDEAEYASWMFDEQTGMDVYTSALDDLLYVGLRAPGTGWLSIGFDPVLRMQGANIIIASIEDETLTIEDHYGNSPVSHRRDAVDHVVQAAGTEENDVSILEFAFPLDSGDDQDKALIAGDEVTIILAFHRSSDQFTVRHSERSTTSIRLGG